MKTETLVKISIRVLLLCAVVLLLFVLAVHSQTRITPSQIRSTTQVVPRSFSLNISASTTQAGLQFDVLFPPETIAYNAVIGGGALAAGKTITCSPMNAMKSITCIIIGLNNNNFLGAVASVNYQTVPDPSLPPVVQNIMGTLSIGFPTPVTLTTTLIANN